MRPASKKTGMATTRPVMPSAHAAFSSPNFRTMVTASVCAPPDSSRMAPNMEPRPTRRAMPFKVLPMPSLTEPMMSDRGIPAIRPMPTAPIRMEIIAWTLNLMIRMSNRIRPATAAKTSRAASGVATAVIEISSVFRFLIALIQAVRENAQAVYFLLFAWSKLLHVCALHGADGVLRVARRSARMASISSGVLGSPFTPTMASLRLCTSIWMRSSGSTSAMGPPTAASGLT